MRAIRFANAAIFAKTNEASQYWSDRNRQPRADAHELTRWLGIRTTLVTVAFEGNTATIAHVGDSRAYRFREGRLLRLNEDHRLREDARRNGTQEEEIEAIPHKLITGALGVSADVEVSVSTINIWDGDIFLLCSNGLTDSVPDSDIKAILTAGQLDLDRLARTLITAALQHGDLSLNDNLTVLLVGIDAGFSWLP